MSTRKFYFQKQPAEIFSIEVEFAADLGTTETILSAVVTAIDTADDSNATAIVITGVPVIDTGEQTLSIVRQKIQAGTDRFKYKITFRATTSDSNVFEADVIMKVKDW